MDVIGEALKSAKAEIASASTVSDLTSIEHAYLGKKGVLSVLTKEIPMLSADQRPAFGQRLNDARREVESLIEDRRAVLLAIETATAIERDRVDVTFPGTAHRSAGRHPLTITAARVKAALIGLGFEFLESPEIEKHEYNFGALNYPDDHPAMDEQNSFLLADGWLLRTQTTAVQGRAFETKKPPMRCAIIGRCFRYEAVDATHHHTFHQVDAFMIDRGISMANLKATLGQFARAMFGPGVRVRFRPDFFPFVEPGVDYSVSCFFCDGQGCGICKKSGWIELGGAGLIHPNILERYGIDPEEWSGFAFGLGIERIPMLQYGVDDLRLFLENDLRFLDQFRSLGG
ncbi:MAG: phenylalanine--tRNA ligase subunit alpha [Armatimonadetes bacterium]|nr:phenylalanine--tRNA ligase subunit alpha [Armatimonadota bacterium]